MFGTDFPWYDLDRTVERVYDLPGLTEEEVRGILGLNAARLLGLPHQ
jgi:predicted TIM-barrel fold metal-dependent hydrolase